MVALTSYLEDWISAASVASLNDAHSHIRFHPTALVQSAGIDSPAERAPRVRGEEPVSCLLSVRSSQVQFAEVRQIKESYFFSACQVLSADLFVVSGEFQGVISFEKSLVSALWVASAAVAPLPIVLRDWSWASGCEPARALPSLSLFENGAS